MVSVCYSKAKVAAACAGIVYFLSYVPYMYIAIREEAAGDKISAVVKSLVVSTRSCVSLVWVSLLSFCWIVNDAFGNYGTVFVVIPSSYRVHIWYRTNEWLGFDLMEVT